MMEMHKDSSLAAGSRSSSCAESIPKSHSSILCMSSSLFIPGLRPAKSMARHAIAGPHFGKSLIDKKAGVYVDGTWIPFTTTYSVVLGHMIQRCGSLKQVLSLYHHCQQLWHDLSTQSTRTSRDVSQIPQLCNNGGHKPSRMRLMTRRPTY